MHQHLQEKEIIDFPVLKFMHIGVLMDFLCTSYVTPMIISLTDDANKLVALFTAQINEILNTFFNHSSSLPSARLAIDSNSYVE